MRNINKRGKIKWFFSQVKIRKWSFREASFSFR